MFDVSKVPAGWVAPQDNCPLLLYCKRAPLVQQIKESSGYKLRSTYLIDGLVNEQSCKQINEFMKQGPEMEAVSVQGMKDIKGPEDIGSRRITMWNPFLASEINRLLTPYWFQNLFCDDYFPTDWWQHGKKKEWEFFGVSPMLRYMIYKNGGKHAVHYDAGYIDPKNTDLRTLFSFVLYLSTNDTGATTFIDDKQDKIKVWNRNHEDWGHEPKEKDILYKSYPKKGSMIIFPHRFAHGVEEFTPHPKAREEEQNRIIIRGDLFYKAL